MRKRRAVWLLLLAVLAALGAAVWLLSLGEPVYRGRKLGEWLAEVPISSRPGDTTNAVHAVREVGTNGIPWLLAELDAKDSRLKRQMIALARKQRFIRFAPKPDMERRQRAIMGFRVLGPQADSAVPALLLRLHRPDAASWAASALVAMIIDAPADGLYDQAYASRRGTEKLGLMRREILAAGMTAMTNHQASVRGGGAIIVAYCAVDPAAAVPGLIQGLQDPDETVRIYSVMGLGKITSHPVAAIPPLITSLSDSNVIVRMMAAKSLGSYYRQARTAVPALLKARSDPNGQVRSAVTLALDKIDPETAAAIPDLPDFKPLPPFSNESNVLSSPRP